MTATPSDEDLRALDEWLAAADVQAEADAGRVVGDLAARVEALFGRSPVTLDSEQAARVLMNSAGVLVNAAVIVGSVEHLELAEAWLTDVLGMGSLESAPVIANALYSLANAKMAVADIGIRAALDAGDATDATAANENRAQAFVAARWAQRDRLRDARNHLTWSARLAEDFNADGEARSLCNLGNALDSSGRWIEAYDAYAAALAADPTNGNAAGNAAVLIRYAISRGWDFEGHLCSLYDHYLAIAHANRDRTVEVAGERAARYFDTFEPLGSEEALRHEPDEADPYQGWVVEHRLALVAAFEGLGASDTQGRWDTIGLTQVHSPVSDPDMPSILDILNVLKADFLVARRLGFEACQALDENGGWAQGPHDPGEYTETLKYAVVGEIAARIVLAHRAALDVLDKTAVALNEHLGVGDRPDRINFRTFWFEPTKKPTDKYNAIRGALLQHQPIALHVLAMAELAFDMTAGGIHQEAQNVRNAGTHRFVLLHLDLHDIETTPTLQAIPVDQMVQTMLGSLSVARASYIYLVAMLAAHEAAKAKELRENGDVATLLMTLTP